MSGGYQKENHRFYQNRDCEYFPCHSGVPRKNSAACSSCQRLSLGESCPEGTERVPLGGAVPKGLRGSPLGLLLRGLKGR
ncbi:MAG: hypothetical protein IKK57_07915 [Clostridia bacterium]|nr:hypothetical protein [Clostridia bacterium]